MHGRTSKSEQAGVVPGELRRGPPSKGRAAAGGATVEEQALPCAESSLTPYAQIVVQCERSKAGHDALRAAVEIGRGHACVTVVAAIPVAHGKIGCCGMGGSRWNEILSEEAQDDLRDARRVLSDYPNSEFLDVSGAPAAVLTEVAERLGADLILTPRRPTRALRRGAPCAVLRAAGARAPKG